MKSSLKFHPIRTRSTPEIISQTILERINSGTLQPGQSLPPQREMARMFNVSLTSVRKAIRLLHGMKQVHVIHGKGTFISN